MHLSSTLIEQATRPHPQEQTKLRRGVKTDKSLAVYELARACIDQPSHPLRLADEKLMFKTKRGAIEYTSQLRIGKRKTLIHALEDTRMTDRGHFNVWVESFLVGRYTIGMEYISDYDEVELKKKTPVTYMGPPTEEAALRAATDHELGHRDIELGEWLD